MPRGPDGETRSGDVIDSNDVVPWEGQTYAAAASFGELVRRLNDTNPYADTQTGPPLEQIMITLATELWDQGFSQKEIRIAFESAVTCLASYAPRDKR
jgi:hypothetical protein